MQLIDYIQALCTELQTWERTGVNLWTSATGPPSVGATEKAGVS